MSPRLRILRRFHRYLSLLLVVVMVLPPSFIVLPTAALAAPNASPVAQEIVPTPVPTPSWPGVADQPPYQPVFTPPQPPETQLVTAAPVVAAATEAAAVDTEAGKSGVVVGAASAQLTPDGGQAQLGALQLRVASAAGVLTAPMEVQAEVLPVAQANALSPVGMAFTLHFTPNGAAAAASAQAALQLTLDYSQIPMRYGGSFADRLTLYRASGCQQNASGAPACATWEALPSENDRSHQQLTATLTPLTATPTATEPVQTPDDTLPQRLYLPLVDNGGSTTSADTIYVLAAAASGQQGTYQATPLSNSNDYQVSLATGAMQTSYPIPLPPAAGPLAPTVALQYDSGGVDGMSNNKNNQPGWVGIGWSLEPGYITRRLKTCGLPQALLDLCLTGDNYVLVLNGVAARLVKDANGLYHPQNDPLWKVEKLTSSNTSHPDEQKEYWQVTMPNGTKYRFGGEFDPEKTTGGDQDSAFYVPIYDLNVCTNSTLGGAKYGLCNKVYKWNLDRVEDPNGNVISYYYNQELNYYAARTFIRTPYTRAGNVKRIEYGRRIGSTTTPAQVLFNVEERCTAPGTTCNGPGDYPDTPIDLACLAAGTCTQTAPTFWSRLRLNTIQPQYYNQSTGAWVTIALFDLDYSFPTPPNDLDGDSSEKKLWLTQITQRTADGQNSLPATQYGFTMLKNRRDAEGTNGAGISAMFMPRVSQLTNALGGVVNFTYGKSHECPVVPSGFTEFAYDCYPAWNAASSQPGFTLWNKWKVLSMTVSDSFAGNATETYTYAYSTPVNHYDDDPITPASQKSYSDFRGSAIVTVTDASGAKTEHRFHRGMNGDPGGIITNITLSDGTPRQDDNWLRGQEVETRRLTSANVAKQRTVNWFTSTATAGSGTGAAYFVAVQQTDQTISDTTSKTFSVQYKYDPYGNVIYEARAGDMGTAGDERTLQRSYLVNTTAYIVNKPAWEKLWVGAFTSGTGTAGQEQAFTEYAYDNLAYGAAPTRGNLTKVRAYWQATPSYQSAETTTAYDSYGRPTSVTDARGKVTTTAYHAFYGYVTSVTNALNQVTTYVKDPGWGVITQTTDPNNNVTNLQYDGYGRLTKVWLPTEPTSGLASSEFVYDAAARPANVKTRQLQVKASGAYLESWSYVDGFGRTLQTQTLTSGGGRVVTNQNYNNLGQLVYQSAPYALSGAPGSGYVAITNWNTAPNYHQFYRDEVGRLTKDETRYQATVLWSNQTLYNVTQTTEYDALNHRRDTDSDAFGHLLAVTEYNVGSTFYNTFYRYNTQGNLTQVTDNAGNITTMSYDLLGRKTAMTDPDMGSWQYQYDAVGNLTAQKDGRNQWVYLAYDDLNRLSNKRQDNPTTGALIADYTYDAVGQKGLLSFSRAYSAQGTIQINNVTYDTRNRLTQQTWSVPSTGGGSFRMDYAYNEANQRTSLTYPGGNTGTQGETVTNSYNAIGQLTGVSGLAGMPYVSSATYNAQGQLTQLVNENGNGANGLTRQWSYETNTLRLSTMQAGTNASFDNLQKLTYSYDNVGNVTSLVDTVNSGQKQCFQSDWLSRLTGAFTGDAACTIYSATGTGPYNHTYGYDGLGNITSNAGNSYTYGDAAHKHAVTAAFGNSYGYDANGNQTTRTIGGVTYTFTYDYENHLTAVSGGSISASFVYDADGNRVKGTVNGTTTVYIAGLYEYQGGATTLYYEGNALRRTGYATDNGVFYVLRDQLQSSSVMINQNGTVNSRNYFYPFGGNRGGAAFSSLTTKRFTGQYQEAGLPGGEGLSYYGARWYDAQLGRFTSADTIVPGPTNPQTLNRYAYTLNNPLRYTDPTGHSVDGPGIGAGGTAVTKPHTLYLPIASNGGGGGSTGAPQCGGNPLCWFGSIRWQDAKDTRGLQADWLRLTNDIWYYQQRPNDLGVWRHDTQYPDIDSVLITDPNYASDIMSRPLYSNGALPNFWKDVQKKYGAGKLPNVGFNSRYYFGFGLVESATPNTYNAVEWYLGSFNLSMTVTKVDTKLNAVSVQVMAINYSGWESATRFPQRFVPYLGPSILPNRGGRPTQGAWIGEALLQAPPFYGIWSTYGETYQQMFQWETTITFPN